MENNQITECQLTESKKIDLNETTLPIKIQNIRIVQQPTKECRICLSSTETHDSPFISPCECQGSLKFIHQLCLKKWMEIKFSQNQEQYLSKTHIDCQLCKTGIKVHLSLKRECRNCSSIKRMIKQSSVLFVIFLRGLVVSLGVHFFSIKGLVQQIRQGYGDVDLIAKAVIIVSLPVQLLLVLYFMFQLIDFCVAKRATLQVE